MTRTNVAFVIDSDSLPTAPEGKPDGVGTKESRGSLLVHRYPWAYSRKDQNMFSPFAHDFLEFVGGLFPSKLSARLVAQQLMHHLPFDGSGPPVTFISSERLANKCCVSEKRIKDLHSDPEFTKYIKVTPGTHRGVATTYDLTEFFNAMRDWVEGARTIYVEPVKAAPANKGSTKPEPTPTAPEPKGTSEDAALKDVHQSWYAKNPTVKGSPIRENVLTFLANWKACKVDLAPFVQAVAWRLDRYDKDDRDNACDYLGSLSNFLKNDTWRAETPPAPIKPKVVKPHGIDEDYSYLKDASFYQ